MNDEADHAIWLGEMNTAIRVAVHSCDEATARALIESIVEYAANVGLDSEYNSKIGDVFPRWVLERVPFAAVAMIAYKLGVQQADAQI